MKTVFFMLVGIFVVIILLLGFSRTEKPMPNVSLHPRSLPRATD